MRYLPGIFAVLTLIAGWHYLMHSTAAGRLAGLEQEKLNRRRTHWRRAGGLVMLLTGMGVLFATYGFDQQNPGAVLLMIWLAVCALLVAMVVLALLDLRLTWKLRRGDKE